MKETKKRILSIALAFGMVLTMAGISSVAIGISGARNAQTVANGDQNAIGDDANFNANDIKPIVAETSKAGEVWEDYDMPNGDFEAANSASAVNELGSVGWSRNNSGGDDGGAGGTATRDTTGKITGQGSMKFYTPATLSWGTAMYAHFDSATTRFRRGAEAMTFKVKTDKPINLFLTLQDFVGGDIINEYVAQIAVPAATTPGAVQEVVAKLSDFKKETTDILTGMGDRIYTVATELRLRFQIYSTESSEKSIYLDDFKQTKQSGYQKDPILKQYDFARGGFEQDDSVVNRDAGGVSWTYVDKHDESGINPIKWSLDTEKAISGNRSLKMESIGRNDWGNQMHLKMSGPDKIISHTNAVSLKVKTNLTQEMEVGFYNFDENKSYSAKVIIPAGDDYTTVTVKYTDIVNTDGTNVTQGINFWTNSNIRLSLIFNSNGSSLVYLDDVALTPATGYLDAHTDNKIVSLTTSNDTLGVVSGQNAYKPNKKATITAAVKPNVSAKFVKWVDTKNADALVSSLPTYTFTPTAQNTSYKAVFEDIAKLAVTAVADPVNGGSVSGVTAGGYLPTTDASLTATANSGYKFAGWADSTGKIISTDLTYNFVVTEKTDLKAKFVSETYVVIYKDNDGRIISTQGVTQGGNAVVPTAPTREGYTFSNWSSNGQNITADTVITAIYTRTAKRTITVTNGTISEQGDPVNQYLIGTLITVTANAPTAGNKFSHWTDASGNKLSTESTYFFIVATDIALIPVYVADTEDIVKKPFITLDATAINNTQTGVITFNARKYMTDGYTFKECGMIFYKGTVTGDLTLETAGMKKAKSSQQLVETGQFQMFFKPTVAATYSARAYMIFTDTTGNIFTVYSDNTLTVTKS